MSFEFHVFFACRVQYGEEKLTSIDLKTLAQNQQNALVPHTATFLTLEGPFAHGLGGNYLLSGLEHDPRWDAASQPLSKGTFCTVQRTVHPVVNI